MGKDLDEVVDWLAGRDEKHHTAWLLELLDELADAAGSGLVIGNRAAESDWVRPAARLKTVRLK